MSEIEVNRNSHLIDPHLHVWGWEVPVYLFLGGLAAGIMVLGALLILRRGADQRSSWSRWAVFLAPLFLSIGMLALLMDLEYKLHVWRFYTAFEVTSPMSWGSWLLLLIYPATLALGLATLTAQEVDLVANFGLVRRLGLTGRGGLAGRVRQAHAWAAGKVRGMAWLNLLLGLALGIYTGVLLGALGARPAWNSALLGPLFMVSGVSTGAALMMLLPMKREEHAMIQRWDVGAILIEACLLFLFIMTLLTGGGQPGRDAAELFLGGSYTALFWSLVVIVGLAVPLTLEVIEMAGHRRPTVLAPFMLLIGGLALRFIIVSAGQV
jgi:formate-dependent nitrite reductase membrane component NrfD